MTSIITICFSETKKVWFFFDRLGFVFFFLQLTVRSVCRHKLPSNFVKLSSVICLQSVPGEMEQIQPLLSGTWSQQGGLQPTRDGAECRGEGTARAQGPQAHQGSHQRSLKLCFWWPSHQVDSHLSSQQQERCVHRNVHVRWWFLSLFFSKFINMMMEHGNKVLAREIMTQVKKKTC